MPPDSSPRSSTSSPSGDARAERKSALNDAHRSRWRRGQWIAFVSAIVVTFLVLLGFYAPLGLGPDPTTSNVDRETVTLDDLDTSHTVDDTPADGSRADTSRALDRSHADAAAPDP